MSSDRCPPDSRRKRSFRERRTSIACTLCRQRKKKCKPGGGAGCQRCDATGRECRYTRVRDDSSSSQVLDSPSPAVEPVILEHEGSDIAPPFPVDEMSMEQLSLYLDLVGASNTSPQPPTFQNYSYSQTPETPYFSNIIHDADSNRYAPYDIANFELFIPNTPANPSVPRSAYGPSIAYSQYVDASSYLLPYVHPPDPSSAITVSLTLQNHTTSEEPLRPWHHKIRTAASEMSFSFHVYSDSYYESFSLHIPTEPWLIVPTWPSLFVLFRVGLVCCLVSVYSRLSCLPVFRL